MTFKINTATKFWVLILQKTENMARQINNQKKMQIMAKIFCRHWFFSSFTIRNNFKI